MIRPLRWVSKLLGLPETNIVKCYVLQTGYKMEEPRLVEASTFLFLRFASFQWNLHHGSKLHVKLLQNRCVFFLKSKLAGEGYVLNVSLV